eukprot:scaffold4983_cov258-Chaetoceros_neogracile.AAC.2
MAFRPFALQKAYKSLLVPINLANNIMYDLNILDVIEFPGFSSDDAGILPSFDWIKSAGWSGL